MGSGKSTKIRVFTGVSKVATELLEKANGLLLELEAFYRVDGNSIGVDDTRETIEEIEALIFSPSE
jgi:hypothetical protein